MSYWIITAIFDAFGALYCATICEAFSSHIPKKTSKKLSGNFNGYEQIQEFYATESEARNRLTALHEMEV